MHLYPFKLWDKGGGHGMCFKHVVDSLIMRAKDIFIRFSLGVCCQL